MGQRLVVTVRGDRQDIAKIYFHWSAYSINALLETKKIVDCIYDHEDEEVKDLQLRLIRFCEENGGGIKGDLSEFEYIKKLYPNENFKTDNYSRNYGLIAISENGMKELQEWSEGNITIFIDEEEEGIINTVFSWYQNIDEYNEDRREWDDDFDGYKLEDLTDIGYDLSDFNIEDLDDIIIALDGVSYVCRHGNEIFSLIE